jgi:signal-transduction protein with cAMP-binding, CBS, and nucleotidyltransferase domain
MHVGNICARSIAVCAGTATVADVAREMRDHQLGEVVVTETRNERTCPLGIITGQDIVMHVVAAGLDPTQVRARDLLVGSVETVLDSELVYDAIWHMRSTKLRHLAVVDAHDGLLGVLRADDVSEFLASELTEVARISPYRAEAASPPGSHAHVPF